MILRDRDGTFLRIWLTRRWWIVIGRWNQDPRPNK